MKIKLNIKYLCAFILIFIIELLIAVFARDNFIRHYLGDVLVVILIYTFVKSFVRNEIKLLWLYIFIFAALVEVGQYFNFVDIIGFGEYRLARIIFGTVFDMWDIICYFAGCLMILFFEKVIRDKTPVKELFSNKRKILKSLFIFSLVIISIHAIHALTLDRIIEYKEISFYSSKISVEMDGYRIAFVADTHRMPEERLKEAAKKLNEMQIDLLVLGGDYTIIPDAMRRSVEILSQIKTTDGIYGVEGNHDNYMILFAAMEEYGITPLSNEGVYIRDNLFLAGVEDLWNRSPDIAKATQEATPENFVVLLAHNPDVTMKQDTSGVDLILSGHTHAGQISFLGIWAPYFTFRTIITEYGQRFTSGWSESRDGVSVYVTNGTGEYMPRVFARPQVIIFTLRSER